MTSIFSYMEIENLETFHVWKFYDKHFLTIRNPAKWGKKNYFNSHPIRREFSEQRKKNQRKLISHSQFSSHTEKAEHFLILS